MEMISTETLGLLVTIFIVVGGALWKLSFQVASMVTELRNIKELLTKGEDRMERHEQRLNDHDGRIKVLELK